MPMFRQVRYLGTVNVIRTENIARHVYTVKLTDNRASAYQYFQTQVQDLQT